MQALRTLVIVLGVLIVLGIGLVAYGFYVKLNDPGGKLFSASNRAEKAEISPGFVDVRLPLPAGCSIVEMRPDGRLVHLRIGPAGSCERIVIIDITSGAIIGSITPAPVIPMPR